MMNLKLTLAPLLLAALTSLAHAGHNSKPPPPTFADDPAAIEFAATSKPAMVSRPTS